ncbi:uncharacterized protein [Bemisia tabaci]|uniref:uncharacterized protein n=1 Tax=Bemisia tabaci TaxID=7038 RepID=UPI003B284DAC
MSLPALLVFAVLSIVAEGNPSQGVRVDQLSSGVFFQKWGPVAYTSTSYSVVLKYNLTLLQKQDENLEMDFQQLHSYLMGVKSEKNSTTFLTELELLHSELTEYEGETNALLELVPGGRRTRSLCDGLGRLLSSITGVMDDQDREGMENGFSVLGRRVEELEMEVTPKKLVIQNMLKNQRHKDGALVSKSTGKK